MKEIVVEPVEPTYARTFSRLETVMAVMNERMIRIVEMTANRKSDISRLWGTPAFGALVRREFLEGLPSGEFRRRGRHLAHASKLARHG